MRLRNHDLSVGCLSGGPALGCGCNAQQDFPAAGSVGGRFNANASWRWHPDGKCDPSCCLVQDDGGELRDSCLLLVEFRSKKLGFLRSNKFTKFVLNLMNFWKTKKNVVIVAIYSNFYEPKPLLQTNWTIAPPGDPVNRNTNPEYHAATVHPVSVSAIDRIKTHRWLARRVITVASVSSRRRPLALDDHIAKIPASPGPLVCPVCARFSFDAAWNPFTTTSHLNRTAAASGRLTARFNSSPQYSAAAVGEIKSKSECIELSPRSPFGAHRIENEIRFIA